MQNRELRQLEESLISVLNNSPVIMEAKKYVLISVLHNVEKEANKEIIRENYEEAMQNAPIVEKGKLDHAEST